MVHGGLSVLELRRDCGLGFCGGETDRLDQGAISGGGDSYSSVVVGFLREVEFPEGGGFLSSTLPAWNP
ncbi:hypothetical protein Bca4012_032649 [Brassica carinata]